jgi:hypothetical protein
VVSHLKAPWQKFLQILLRAAWQIEDLAAAVAFKMVMVVQVSLFVERFTTRHLHRLYFTRFEQCVDGAVDGRLADFRLFFLSQGDQIGNAQRAVRLHDDIMDDGALAGLALSNFDHKFL